MGGYPSGSDYVEALQHPSTALADPRLCAASVELDPLGRPRPRSGASACVFRLTAPDRTDYAVKCFTRSAADLRERYDLLAATLGDGTAAPWQVAFEYQEDGIAAGGGRWPVLVMEWVHDAVGLAQYVEQNLHAPTRLARLAAAFTEVCDDLSARGLVHGDLQHGNILVGGNGAIRLIDYDGMWTPRLAGHPGIERGHPNFQPPWRRIEDTGATLDRFSTWVIYVSLLAVAHDAGLWQRFDGGDECLLLRAADYTDPRSSAAFAALAASPVETVRRASAQLAELCEQADPASVPAVDTEAFPVPTGLPKSRRVPTRRVPKTPSRRTATTPSRRPPTRRGNRLRPRRPRISAPVRTRRTLGARDRLVRFALVLPVVAVIAGVIIGISNAVDPAPASRPLTASRLSLPSFQPSTGVGSGIGSDLSSGIGSGLSSGLSAQGLLPTPHISLSPGELDKLFSPVFPAADTLRTLSARNAAAREYRAVATTISAFPAPDDGASTAGGAASGSVQPALAATSPRREASRVEKGLKDAGYKVTSGRSARRCPTGTSRTTTCRLDLARHTRAGVFTTRARLTFRAGGKGAQWRITVQWRRS